MEKGMLLSYKTDSFQPDIIRVLYRFHGEVSPLQKTVE